jgi:hypothetical protein
MHFSALVSFFFVALLSTANAAADSAHDAENATSVPQHPRLLVRTTSGAVLGEHMGPHVIAWRGIPYAEAPLGPLRFEPPRAITRPREHIIDARQYGPSCFQFKYAISIPTEAAPEVQSEDCLTVNIFRRLSNATGTAGAAPTNATSGLLPVLVWVHGGAFTEGSGNSKNQCLCPSIIFRYYISAEAHDPTLTSWRVSCALRLYQTPDALLLTSS